MKKLYKLHRKLVSKDNHTTFSLIILFDIIEISKYNVKMFTSRMEL